VQIFYLKKLNNAKFREQYQMKISDRFASFKNLNGKRDFNTTWGNTIENIKISAAESFGHYELKQHKL
jgi:hypothetical protein